MNRALITVLLSLLLISCSEPSGLDAEGNYVEGVHYKTLAQPFTTDANNIVVTEFFWYGCPHCETFEASLHRWSQRTPDNVVLLQSPAIWSEPMKLHAKLFFIVQSMDNQARIHSKLFPKIISLAGEKDLLKQQQILVEFFEEYGLSQQELEQRLASEAIERQLENAIEMMGLAEIVGTPTILVNGRYIVNNDSAESAEQVMDIANYLITLEAAKYNRAAK